MSIFADAIANVFDSKEYEVTTVVRVRARNIGEAIQRACGSHDDWSVWEDASWRIKDVKEV